MWNGRPKKMWRTYILMYIKKKNYFKPHISASFAITYTTQHTHKQTNIWFDILSQRRKFRYNIYWVLDMNSQHIEKIWCEFGAGNFRGIGPILFALSMQFYNQLIVVYEYLMWCFSRSQRTYGGKFIVLTPHFFSFIRPISNSNMKKVQRFMRITNFNLSLHSV